MEHAGTDQLRKQPKPPLCGATQSFAYPIQHICPPAWKTHHTSPMSYVGTYSDTIPAMTNLTSVLNQLQQERNRLASQLERLNNALSALNGTRNQRIGRRMSAAGRARIAAAQRARWAKAKGEKVVSIRGRKRRKLSSAAIANIRSAQKARWAKWRKQQKAT